jgi:putative ABC transport system substrate-binding protein
MRAHDGRLSSSRSRLKSTYLKYGLKEEKPGDLPAMLPPKFELTLNLKTTKPLGFTSPANLLALADQMIE